MKNILLDIVNQLLERSRLRDEKTDKLRNRGRSLRFLYTSKRKNLKGDAGQVCGWKRRDTLQACQHPINKRRRRCHKHSQVLGKVTDRCPYCAEISLESSFKRVHLTHCHHMNGIKNPTLIPKPDYPLDYEEFTNPPTQEQNVGEELAPVEDLSSEEASNQEPDSAAATSSQSAPPMDLVGDIHSASPHQVGIE